MRGPEAAPFPVDFKEDWLRRQGVKLDPGGAIARSRRITKLVAFQEEHGQSQGEWRIRFKAALIAPLYSHELITNDLEIEECDARANHESWEDMVRLQTEGAYPAAFSKIESPVLMLHGAADPHPGRMISASLKPHLPQIQYIEWDRCGHYPWLERAVQEEFFVVLRSWLARHLSAREERPSKPADTG